MMNSIISPRTDVSASCPQMRYDSSAPLQEGLDLMRTITKEKAVKTNIENADHHYKMHDCFDIDHLCPETDKVCSSIA